MLGINSTKNLGQQDTFLPTQVTSSWSFRIFETSAAQTSSPDFEADFVRAAQTSLCPCWAPSRLVGKTWPSLWLQVRMAIAGIALMFLFANSITNEWMNVGVSWRFSILFSSTSTLKRWRKVTLKVLSLRFITLRCCSSLGPGQWWHYCLASRHHFASLVAVGFWIRFCGVGHPVLRQVPLDLTTIFWEWKFQLIFFFAEDVEAV